MIVPGREPEQSSEEMPQSWLDWVLVKEHGWTYQELDDTPIGRVVEAATWLGLTQDVQRQEREKNEQIARQQRQTRGRHPTLGG